jgi:hypothetical protein
MHILRSREREDPRRRVLLRALAAGLFSGGAIPGLTIAQSVLGDRPARLPADRSIYRVFGDVQVNGKPASLQTRIEAADTVRTGRDGEIVYVIGENAFIQRRDSEVAFDGGRSAVLDGLRIVTGALLSVFAPGRPLRLSTQTATIGIRGTGVYVEAEPQRTYFCTCYGVADVAATNDSQSKETVKATHHDNPLYILAGEPLGRNVRRAPFINHTDQELMMIEALVGREPPFDFPKDSYRAPRREY